MPAEFRIGTRVVSESSPSYVIAEIGHNHQGDLEKCKALFRSAAEAGADAVKLQKRDNATLFTKEMYDSPYASENAYGDTYGTHREALEFGHKEYSELKAYAEQLGVLFLSTAFDEASADFLADLDMPAYKIASGDLNNTPLLRKVAKIGKPMIISSGGASLENVRRAHDTVVAINPNLCILQCTSGYPPAYDELNLRVIETFREAFPDTVIGFSSHDSGISMPLIAYMLGARVFEKHFTLNRAARGTDHAFSLEPAGLRRVIRDLNRTIEALGDGVKRPYTSETKPLNKMVKRMVAARDLSAGVVLSEKDIAFRIPVESKITAKSLEPLWLDHFVGKTLKVPVAADQIIGFDEIGEQPQSLA